MIRIKDLGFSYGENVVLKDITMNLEEGRIYGPFTWVRWTSKSRHPMWPG